MRRAFCFFLLLAGCGPCERAPSPKTLVLGTLREPATLDPAFARTSAEQEIVRLLFRDLTVLDDRWRLVPDLAAAVPTASTATVTWVLEPNHRWSDGRPITASDARFGFEVESDPEHAAVNFDNLRKVRRFEVLDEQSFSVAWSGPYVDAVAPRVHSLLPAHAYPTPKGARSALGADVVSSGPYALERWVPGEHLIARRNEGWGGTKPFYDRIIFRFIRSEDGLVTALEAGEIDGVGEASGLGLSAVDHLRSRLDKTHVVELRPSAAWLHLEVRLDHPLLSKVQVRHAINATIDRAAIAKVAYAGHAAPAHSIFPERHRGYLPPDAPPDLSDAKRIIRAAGEKDRAIELMYGTSPAAEAAATVIADQLGALGLTVRPRGVHFRVLSERVDEKTHAPLVLLLWRTSPLWDGRSVLHTEGRQNLGGYTDPEMDRRLDAAARAPDRATWADHLKAVNRRFMTDLPVIPLLFRKVVSVRPADLTGWSPTGTRTPVTWNAEMWRKTR